MADLNMARLIVVTRIAAGGRDLTTRALTITPEKLRIRRIKKKGSLSRGAHDLFSLLAHAIPPCLASRAFVGTTAMTMGLQPVRSRSARTERILKMFAVLNS